MCNLLIPSALLLNVKIKLIVDLLQILGSLPDPLLITLSHIVLILLLILTDLHIAVTLILLSLASSRLQDRML